MTTILIYAATFIIILIMIRVYVKTNPDGNSVFHILFGKNTISDQDKKWIADTFEP